MRRYWFYIQVFVPVLWLSVSACSTSHRIEGGILADGPQGAVSLQHVDDALFKAAHPVSASPQLVRHILRGAQALPDDVTAAMRVFSDDEIWFLSPLISKALATAAENQVVEFRVVRGKNLAEAFGGIVYVQGRLLHFALTYYHTNPDRKISGQEQDPAFSHSRELEPSQLAFIPETDHIFSINEQGVLVTPPPLGTLIIDYQMFSSQLDRPSPTARPESAHVGSLPCPQAHSSSSLQDNEVTALHETPSGSAGETQILKNLVCEQAIELDALKKDMRMLRHTLSEIEARKNKSTKPELLPAQRRRILNRVSNFSADPSCNSISRLLCCRRPWSFDILRT